MTTASIIMAGVSAASAAYQGVSASTSSHRQRKYARQQYKQQRADYLSDYEMQLQDSYDAYDYQMAQNQKYTLETNKQSISDTLDANYQWMKAHGYNYTPESASGTSMTAASMSMPSLEEAQMSDAAGDYSEYDAIANSINYAISTAQSIANIEETKARSEKTREEITLTKFQEDMTKKMTEKYASEITGIDIDNWIKSETSEDVVATAKANLESIRQNNAKMATETKILDFTYSTQPELWDFTKRRLQGELDNLAQQYDLNAASLDLVREQIATAKFYNTPAMQRLQKQMVEAELQFKYAQTDLTRAQERKAKDETTALWYQNRREYYRSKFYDDYAKNEYEQQRANIDLTYSNITKNETTNWVAPIGTAIGAIGVVGKLFADNNVSNGERMQSIADANQRVTDFFQAALSSDSLQKDTFNLAKKQYERARKKGNATNYATLLW